MRAILLCLLTLAAAGCSRPPPPPAGPAPAAPRLPVEVEKGPEDALPKGKAGNPTRR